MDAYDVFVITVPQCYIYTWYVAQSTAADRGWLLRGIVVLYYCEYTISSYYIVMIRTSCTGVVFCLWSRSIFANFLVVFLYPVVFPTACLCLVICLEYPLLLDLSWFESLYYRIFGYLLMTSVYSMWYGISFYVREWDTTYYCCEENHFCNYENSS